eukprot:2403679-Pyramimonas_sp.AAC.1
MSRRGCGRADLHRVLPDARGLAELAARRVFANRKRASAPDVLATGPQFRGPVAVDGHQKLRHCIVVHERQLGAKAAEAPQLRRRFIGLHAAIGRCSAL